MPIIKDKYGAKGENTRSKYVTRKNNKVIDSPVSSSMSTFQKKELEADNIRSAGTQQSLYGADQSNVEISERIGLISGFKMASSTANILENVLILNNGESLKNISISHYSSGGSSAVFSLYWSTYSLQEITYSAGEGVVSEIKRGTLYRLMTDTLVSSSTLTLNNNNVLGGFDNINKTIYIYAISSVRGTELTMLKC